MARGGSCPKRMPLVRPLGCHMGLMVAVAAFSAFKGSDAWLGVPAIPDPRPVRLAGRLTSTLRPPPHPPPAANGGRHCRWFYSLKAEKEDTQEQGRKSPGAEQDERSSSILQSLPLPLLPPPFNATLANLIKRAGTPSGWRIAKPENAAKDWTADTAPSPVPVSGPPSIPRPPTGTGKGRSRLQHTISKNTQRVPVTSPEQLEDLLQDGVSVYQMDIRGVSLPGKQDSRGRLVSPLDGRPNLEQLEHPVIAALQERRRTGSKPGARKDGYKIALAIEGGGLRGCVSAGMASALAHLGVDECFDMVLGSSAGSIIGAYLVGRSSPETTYQFFCNHLTTSKDHLNGASWLDIARLVDLFRPSSSASSRSPRPVMLLDYPMDDIMQRLCPLDWETFRENDQVQPMKVVAAGLVSEGPVALGTAEGSFSDLSSLCNCIKASCMLPGIAGVTPAWHRGSSAPQLVQRYGGELDGARQPSSEDARRRAEGMEPMVRSYFCLPRCISCLLLACIEKKAPCARRCAPAFHYRLAPQVDALVYEPIPYRTALSQGATHVLILRSYPGIGVLRARS